MMKGQFALVLKSILVVISIMSTQVFAEIPKRALDACNGKNKEDACTITRANGKTIDGVCKTPPKANGSVVCIPKPPKEAFDACNGKAEGDSCSFTNRNNKEKSGTCHKGLEGNMRCKPTRLISPASTPGTK